MGGNRRKSTPGKTLMGFVAIVAIVAIFNVRDFVSRESDEESYYPTALGDGDFFAVAEGAFGVDAARSFAPTPISSGDVDVTASVSAVFAIVIPAAR